MAGLIAKVGDHASRRIRAQLRCGKIDGIAATALGKDPARIAPAHHSPNTHESCAVTLRAPESPLRRLSRPLLARESYNSGEMKSPLLSAHLSGLSNYRIFRFAVGGSSNASFNKVPAKFAALSAICCRASIIGSANDNFL